MSYEKGDKFVLEIDEVIEVEGVKNQYYRCKNSEIIFNEHELKRLIGISETPEKAYNRGYYDGSHKGFNLTKDEIEKARAEGAEEAWEFRNIATYDNNSDEYEWCVMHPKAFLTMSYAEAKADFEKWKAAQKWEPKIGDIVICHGERGVLIRITNYSSINTGGIMWTSYGCEYGNLKDMSPTGEHIDLSSILEALK